MIYSEKFEHKVLITGASGFVGRRLRDALLDAGADVVAIRRRTSPEPDRGRSVVADYADVDGLKKVVADERPDYVFHVAGATKGVTYADFQRANVMPTENLLSALESEHSALERFVLVSSLAAFGPSSISAPHVETVERRPIEHYGESKREAEQKVEAVGGLLPWTIVRPAGVYGPGDVDYFNLFREASRGRNVYFGNKDRWFSAVYVDDCVRALIAAARSERARGEGYFICDGKPVTWGDFQQRIADQSKRRVMTLNLPEFLVDLAAAGGELATKFDGKPRLFNRQKAKMGAQDAWTCSSDKACEHFDYAPSVGIDEGIRRAFEWYRENGWL